MARPLLPALPGSELWGPVAPELAIPSSHGSGPAPPLRAAASGPPPPGLLRVPPPPSSAAAPIQAVRSSGSPGPVVWAAARGSGAAGPPGPAAPRNLGRGWRVGGAGGGVGRWGLRSARPACRCGRSHLRARPGAEQGGRPRRWTWVAWRARIPAAGVPSLERPAPRLRCQGRSRERGLRASDQLVTDPFCQKTSLTCYIVTHTARGVCLLVLNTQQTLCEFQLLSRLIPIVPLGPSTCRCTSLPQLPLLPQGWVTDHTAVMAIGGQASLFPCEPGPQGGCTAMSLKAENNAKEPLRNWQSRGKICENFQVLSIHGLNGPAKPF